MWVPLCVWYLNTGINLILDVYDKSIYLVVNLTLLQINNVCARHVCRWHTHYNDIDVKRYWHKFNAYYSHPIILFLVKTIQSLNLNKLNCRSYLKLFVIRHCFVKLIWQNKYLLINCVGHLIIWSVKLLSLDKSYQGVNVTSSWAQIQLIVRGPPL